MPYIKPVDRQILAAENFAADSPGELNYVITQVCVEYFELADKKNYATYNEIIGALECAKMEFYRRMIAPYENTKCKENGDVYPG